MLLNEDSNRAENLQMPTPKPENSSDGFLEKDPADDWDRQMKADAEAGRLDALVQEAMADLRDGRCTDL